MKSIPAPTLWVKRFTPFWLGLSILLLASTNLPAKSPDQMASHILYINAVKYANDQDFIHATIYLFAYVQQNPPEYANNINGHKTTVDNYLQFLQGVTRQKVNFLYEVETDINKCRKYPCNQGDLDVEFGLEIPPPLAAPPDAVMVCTKPQYRGACNMLYVGNYRTHQSLGVDNDSIASVMVGSRVKITLYAHSIGSSPLITLTQNDPDLNDNRSSDKVPWSRQVSTAKVEWR